jgi:integrase
LTKNTKSVTDREIRNLKSGERLVDQGDSSGLRIKKSTKGITSFFYRYRHPVSNKIKQVKLGVYPELSLAQARVKLLELKAKRASGIDPRFFIEERKTMVEERCAESSKSILTIENMVELYLTQRIEDRITKSGERIAGARVRKGQIETRRTLKHDVIDVIGDRDAATLSRKDISELIMRIVDRGAPVQAGSVLRELCLVYEYAIGLDWFSENFSNPAEKAKSTLKQANIKLTNSRGSRAFSDEELSNFMCWLAESKLSMPVKGVFLLTIWTGCRTGEICTARWENVDLDKGILHLPTTKSGAKRNVQLSRQAVEYLRSIKLVTGTYLFPSQKTKKAITQNHLTSQTWHLRKSGDMLDIEHWTPHDLRRTVRTGLARLRIPNEVAEAVLGHAPKGIVGTYNLHHYEEECREALQLWADHMEQLQQKIV